VDYIQYSDEIAELVGCKPSLWRLLLSDPVLAFRCFVGPCSPPQYRLTGPGIWPGAREAIMNADINLMHSTKTRAVKRDKQANSSLRLTVILFVFLVIVIGILIRKYL
jgi:dimethylaniline monooxygenase (N-oxide forming)